jgi:hypothetical protein
LNPNLFTHLNHPTASINIYVDLSLAGNKFRREKLPQFISTLMPSFISSVVLIKHGLLGAVEFWQFIYDFERQFIFEAALKIFANKIEKEIFAPSARNLKTKEFF